MILRLGQKEVHVALDVSTDVRHNRRGANTGRRALWCGFVLCVVSAAQEVWIFELHTY